MALRGVYKITGIVDNPVVDTYSIDKVMCKNVLNAS